VTAQALKIIRSNDMMKKAAEQSPQLRWSKETCAQLCAAVRCASSTFVKYDKHVFVQFDIVKFMVKQLD